MLDRALRRGCWIYGGGHYGELVAKTLEARGIEVAGMIDRRYRPTRWGRASDVTRRAPVEVRKEDSAGQTLLIAVNNFATDQKPIVEWGRAAGFAEIILPAELPDVLGPEVGSYWNAGRRVVADHSTVLQHVAGLLADQQSVDVLAGIARFRATGSIDDYPASDLESQYFPDDVPLTREPLRLVDGGAFTGDIIAAAAYSGREIAEWYAFEPDPENFLKLIATAESAAVSRTALFQCALGDRSSEVRFAAAGDAGSHAAEDGQGDMMVQVIAIDEIVPLISPNYVKLDIEGFEREALLGMWDMLGRCRPQLAVSIYHKPKDLWELPLLVHKILPEARLYMRQHGFNGYDTVLYAIPDETPAASTRRN